MLINYFSFKFQHIQYFKKNYPFIHPTKRVNQIFVQPRDNPHVGKVNRNTHKNNKQQRIKHLLSSVQAPSITLTQSAPVRMNKSIEYTKNHKTKTIKKNQFNIQFVFELNKKKETRRTMRNFMFKGTIKIRLEKVS